MRHLWMLTIAVLGLCGDSPAQGPMKPSGSGLPAVGGIGSSTSGTGPGFSPYLNLTRSGNSAAANLYGIVRPQLSMQSSLRSLEQQANAGSVGDRSLDDGQGVVVGPRVRFLNTGGYFLNLSGGTSQPLSGGLGYGQPLNRVQPNSFGGTAGSGGSFGTSGRIGRTGR